MFVEMYPTHAWLSTPALDEDYPGRAQLVSWCKRHHMWYGFRKRCFNCVRQPLPEPQVSITAEDPAVISVNIYWDTKGVNPVEEEDDV